MSSAPDISLVNPGHRRPEVVAAARGNLAAMILERRGIDPAVDVDQVPDEVKAELRELAQALGLDHRPVREPGYCLCGVKLPLTAMFAGAGGYGSGQCKTCRRDGGR